MLDDTLTRVSWRARPRSFVALMGLYESNYIRFGRLAGDLARLAGKHVSCVSGDCDLLLDVTERTPYTTAVTLTYLLQDGPVESPYPDMRVRLYHDARVAEGHEWAAHHERAALRALRGHAERELDLRWARNVMLNKWLDYCLERGHRFSPATQASA